ncbi:MAG: Holliday junction branch migration protein RuvA [Pseudomonadota bacterium]|nr:Holliday junction branch migration protein RuvA [Pseudomonadota bacterium]
MIGRLHGVLCAKNPPVVVLDVHGVGYELEVPMSTFCELPALETQVLLHTHQVIREDAHLLFGFATLSERNAFRLLLRVGGVGPKLALALLSGLSVSELAGVVARQEPGRLTRIPGVGKKTAERLLLELRDKFVDTDPGVGAAGPVAGASGAMQQDVANALLALGYNDKEIARAMKDVPDGMAVEEAIRRSLRLLSRVD